MNQKPNVGGEYVKLLEGNIGENLLMILDFSFLGKIKSILCLLHH